MTTTEPTPYFDLLVLKGFFDERRCAQIVAAMHSGASNAAPVYGLRSTGSVDERMRKVVQHTPAAETVAFVRQKLLDCQREVETHFGIELRECEQPQFLRYRIGDFFVAHQDGNTGMTRIETEARRISIVIFLSRQSDIPQEGAYCGGSLVFHEWRPGRVSGDLRFAGEAGTLVAFRSETTHEVIPVTHGERHSIVGWYR